MEDVCLWAWWPWPDKGVVSPLSEGKTPARFSPQDSPIRQQQSVPLGGISHPPQQAPPSRGRRRERGSILIITLALVILLVSLVGGFLFATGIFISNSGWEETDMKTLWLAEAGLQKAIWNLKTPTGSSGQGESWTTAGTT